MRVASLEKIQINCQKCLGFLNQISRKSRKIPFWFDILYLKILDWAIYSSASLSLSHCQNHLKMVLKNSCESRYIISDDIHAINYDLHPLLQCFMLSLSSMVIFHPFKLRNTLLKDTYSNVTLRTWHLVVHYENESWKEHSFF